MHSACACWAKLTLKTEAVSTYKTSADFNQPSKLRVLVIRQRACTPHSLRDLWFSRRWVLGWRASGPWRNISVRLTGHKESHFRRPLFFTRYQHDFCNVRKRKWPLSILSTLHHTFTIYSFLTACPVWSGFVQHCYRYQMTYKPTQSFFSSRKYYGYYWYCHVTSIVDVRMVTSPIKFSADIRSLHRQTVPMSMS